MADPGPSSGRKQAIHESTSAPLTLAHGQDCPPSGLVLQIS